MVNISFISLWRLFYKDSWKVFKDALDAAIVVNEEKVNTEIEKNDIIDEAVC